MWLFFKRKWGTISPSWTGLRSEELSRALLSAQTCWFEVKSQSPTEKAPLYVTPEELPLLSHPLAPVKLLSVKANPSLADKVTAFSTSRCCRSLQEWLDAGIWSQLQLLCILQRVQGNKEAKSSGNLKKCVLRTSWQRHWSCPAGFNSLYSEFKTHLCSRLHWISSVLVCAGDGGQSSKRVRAQKLKPCHIGIGMAYSISYFA